MNRFVIPSALIGFLLVAVGTTMYSRPLGLIVAGIMLLVGSILAAQKGTN